MASLSPFVIQKDHYDFLIYDTDDANLSVAIVVVNKNTGRIKDMGVMTIRTIEDISTSKQTNIGLSTLLSDPESDKLVDECLITKYNIVNEIMQAAHERIKKENATVQEHHQEDHQ